MRRLWRWSDVLRCTLLEEANPAQDNPNSMPDDRGGLQIKPYAPAGSPE
jgi:hypothetical protein